MRYVPLIITCIVASIFLIGLCIGYRIGEQSKDVRACLFAQGYREYADGFIWMDHAGNLRGAIYEPLSGDIEACERIGEKLEPVTKERWNDPA